MIAGGDFVIIQGVSCIGVCLQAIPLGGVACFGYFCLSNASKRPAGRMAWGK